MPNLTTALPRRTGNLEDDYDRLYNWAVSLTDELKSLLCNLDAGNVSEAGSIKAQNIDASQAKIKDAQIASLTANKLTAGIIDAGQVTVKGENDNGSMELTGDSLVFLDKDNNKRVFIGNVSGEVYFILQNAGGSQKVEMNDEGEISLTGNINTTQDCFVQGQLIVGNVENEQSKGVAFYCRRFQNADYGYCGGIYPYVLAFDSDGGAVTGGLCIDRALYLPIGSNGYSRAVTENDLKGIQNDISELRRRINAGNNE